MRLRTVEATRQARSRSPWATRPESTGMSDERDGARRDQLEDEVRDAEGRVVGVEVGAGPVEVAEHDDAQPSQGARGEEGAGHDETGSSQRSPGHRRGGGSRSARATSCAAGAPLSGTRARGCAER